MRRKPGLMYHGGESIGIFTKAALITINKNQKNRTTTILLGKPQGKPGFSSVSVGIFSLADLFDPPTLRGPGSAELYRLLFGEVSPAPREFVRNCGWDFALKRLLLWARLEGLSGSYFLSLSF